MNNTKHATDCKKAFGRLDHACPRCQELAAGAPARRGWGPPVRSLAHGTAPSFGAYPYAIGWVR